MVVWVDYLFSNCLPPSELVGSMATHGVQHMPFGSNTCVVPAIEDFWPFGLVADCCVDVLGAESLMLLSSLEKQIAEFRNPFSQDASVILHFLKLLRRQLPQRADRLDRAYVALTVPKPVWAKVFRLQLLDLPVQ